MSIRIGIVALLAAALCIRLVALPWAGGQVEADEVGYLSDGLLRAEGVVQAYKASPSAPLTWFAWMVTWATAALDVVRSGPPGGSYSNLLWVPAALEKALFGYYADLTGLRLAGVLFFLPVTVAAAYALFALGRRHGGLWVAVPAGILGACLPVFVEYAVQARPYALAWALAILAIAAVSIGSGWVRTVGAGILLGLSTATRIDMAVALPLVLIALWRRPEPRVSPLRDVLAVMASAPLAFMVVAPWYLPHLLGNLRLIISIRLYPQIAVGAPSAIENLLFGGIAVALPVTLIGLLLSQRHTRNADWIALAWLALLTAGAMRPSHHGLRHDGGLVVAVVTLLPMALQNIGLRLRQNHRAVVLGAMALVLAGPVVVLGAAKAWKLASDNRPDKAVAWIESNVPAGSRVFIRDRLDIPLPTPAASDALWNEVASPDAWKLKMQGASASRFGTAGSRVPIALSEEHMYLDRAIRRRFYILGAPYAPERPRYRLGIVSDGTMFDLSSRAAIDLLCAEGGVYIHNGPAIPRLGTPTATWLDHSLRGTYIYVVRAGECGKP